jgi:general secretion pathway protein H
MPTSAIGTAERGFTLVELLVVLVIVALMAAVVVVAIPEPGGGVRSEALRLAARAEAARERAVMDNRPIALKLDERGYGFLWRQGGEWQPVGEKPFLRQEFGEGTRAAIDGGAGSIVFDSTGFAEPARLRLVRGRDEAELEIADGGRVRVVR